MNMTKDADWQARTELDVRAFAKDLRIWDRSVIHALEIRAWYHRRRMKSADIQGVFFRMYKPLLLNKKRVD